MKIIGFPRVKSPKIPKKTNVTDTDGMGPNTIIQKTWSMIRYVVKTNTYAMLKHGRRITAQHECHELTLAQNIGILINQLEE